MGTNPAKREKKFRFIERPQHLTARVEAFIDFNHLFEKRRGLDDVQRENIRLPSIYFAHERNCIRTEGGQLLAITEHIQLEPTDDIVVRNVRYRTVGDSTCTAAVESDAATLDEIIEDILVAKISERGATRMDDRISEAGMEDRKKNGYF